MPTPPECTFRHPAPDSDDLTGFIRALGTGFLRAPDPEKTGKITEFWKSVMTRDQHRLTTAHDPLTDEPVGTFGAFDHEITVPGGAAVPASGITMVSVSGTHRRRGLLTRMMTDALAADAARGLPIAILVAAEYPIYGRFGFGPAIDLTTYEVDAHRAALRPDVIARIDAAGGRLDLVSGEEYGKLAPEVFERWRPTRAGALRRSEAVWDMVSGRLVHPLDKDGADSFHVVYRDAHGTPAGILKYRTADKENWPGGVPSATLKVQELIAADPLAEAALWRYALSVDWIGKVTAGDRPVDDVLPLLLADSRLARDTETTDFLWLRVLDVPAALEARTYTGAGSVVLKVDDPLGHAAGTFRLDTAPDGTARCEAAPGDSPDLELFVGHLGALYLGGRSAARLRDAGQLTETAEGGVARVDALFATGRKPWCQDGF